MTTLPNPWLTINDKPVKVIKRKPKSKPYNKKPNGEDIVLSD